MREALGRKAVAETFAWLMDTLYSIEGELPRAVREDVLNFRTLCKASEGEELTGMEQKAVFPDFGWGSIRLNRPLGLQCPCHEDFGPICQMGLRLDLEHVVQLIGDARLLWWSWHRRWSFSRQVKVHSGQLSSGRTAH